MARREKEFSNLNHAAVYGQFDAGDEAAVVRGESPWKTIASSGLGQPPFHGGNTGSNPVRVAIPDSPRQIP